jgi:hypothetical protein
LERKEHLFQELIESIEKVYNVSSKQILKLGFADTDVVIEDDGDVLQLNAGDAIEIVLQQH